MSMVHDSPEQSKMKKRVSIEEVDNGYTVSSNDTTKVAISLDSARDMMMEMMSVSEKSTKKNNKKKKYISTDGGKMEV